MNLAVPDIDIDEVILAIESIQPAGKEIKPKRAYACHVCKRSIAPMGRLPCPGFPTCSSDHCLLVPYGKVTEIFKGPYGRTLGRSTLSIISQVYEMPSGRILVRHKPIADQARHLAEAHQELMTWIKAFDDHEWFRWPSSYEKGATHCTPPRSLEDIRLFRRDSEPSLVDPTSHLEEEISIDIKVCRDEGVEALDVGF